MASVLTDYKRIERSILYIIIAEFFVQLVNVTFMNVQPVLMANKGFTKAEISAFMSYRFLGVLLLAVPLGFFIIGKKVKKLFYVSVICVPLFGLGIVYAVHTRNFTLLMLSQLFWGASFTFIQIPIIPFIMRNARVENHTAGISLSYATWSFAGILSGVLIFLLNKISPVIFDEETVIVVISLLSLFAVYFLLKADIQEKVIEKKNKQGAPVRHDWPLIIKALMPTLMLAVGAGLTIPLISEFFHDIHHMDIGDFAPVSTAAALLVAWAAMMVPKIKSRIGFRFAIPVTQSLAVVSLVALATTEFYSHMPIAITIAIVFYLLRQPLMNVAGPMTTEVVMNYVGKRNREIVSMFTSAIWSGSWFLSLMFSASVFDMGYSFVNLFLVTSALYAIGVIWYYLLILDYNRREEKGLIERE